MRLSCLSIVGRSGPHLQVSLVCHVGNGLTTHVPAQASPVAKAIKDKTVLRVDWADISPPTFEVTGRRSAKRGGNLPAAPAGGPC